MLRLTTFIVAAVLAGQVESGRDAATFTRRAAEFDASGARLAAASGSHARAGAALEWLQALGRVLDAIPIARASGPHEPWIQRHDALILYSEPAGQWLISPDLLDRVYAEHAASEAADEIAWIAAANGLPGECEGYVPCYAASLNLLEGEYLRRQPRGAHRADAFDAITMSLRNVLDDLLQRPIREEFLSVPKDCGDLLASLRPLRAAVAGAAGASSEAITLIDRLISRCPNLVLA